MTLSGQSPRAARPRSAAFPLAALALALCATSTGCVSKPTMRVNHAEITGVRVAFPPSIGVTMFVYLDVYNPNSYDVAVRAVRGQSILAGRYTMPVDAQFPGDGVWLAAERTTSMRVALTVPVDVGFNVVREAFSSPTIPFRFVGKADVTAFRSLRIESDDYSVDESGFISRQQVEQALRGGL